MVIGDKIQSILNYIYVFLFVTYTFFSILIMFSAFNIQSPEMVVLYKFVKIIIICSLVLIVLFRPYKIQTMFLMMVVLSIALYGYYINSQERMLIFLLFAFASKNINPRKVLRLDFFVRVLSFVMVIFLYALGVLQKVYFFRPTGEWRDSLGFAHPNYGGIVLLTIVIEWVLLRNKKINLFESLSILGISYVFYKFFLDRTDWILTILLVLLVIVSNSNLIYKSMNHLISTILPLVGWALSILSLIVLFFVTPGSRLYLELNAVLSSRLDIFQFYYKLSGLKILPQNITTYFKDSTFAGMDNSAIYIALFDGMILLFVFCIVEQFIGKNLKNYAINVKLAFLILMLTGLTEALMIYPFINMFVVYYGQYESKVMTNNLLPTGDRKI